MVALAVVVVALVVGVEVAKAPTWAPLLRGLRHPGRPWRGGCGSLELVDLFGHVVRLSLILHGGHVHELQLLGHLLHPSLALRQADGHCAQLHCDRLMGLLLLLITDSGFEVQAAEESHQRLPVLGPSLLEEGQVLGLVL